MAKPEWGAKRTCHSCGARFYDLRRDPIICPVCEALFDPDRQPRLRRGSMALRDEPVLEPDVVEEAPGEEAADEEEAAEVESGEGDLEEVEEESEGKSETLGELTKENQELIEDTSDLGEDDDDIGEVMEHVDNDLEDKP